jgi:hypothetical protein
MLEDGRIYVTRRKTVLNREQKAGFIMVAGFGALALIFGVFYVWKHVASPFVISYTGPKFLTGDEQREQEMEALRNEDTDGDGLSDYDELYLYRTSPYIADSDSDGIGDKTEIDSGADPNCAPSMPCSNVNDAVNPTTLKDTFIEAQVAATASAGTSAAPITPNLQDLAAMFSAMSTEDLQKILIDAGGDEASVKALSDEELRAAIVQALQELQRQQASSDSASSETPLEIQETPTN